MITSRPLALAAAGVPGAAAVAVFVVVGLPALSTWPLILLGALAVLGPFVIGVSKGRLDIFEPIYLFAFTYAVLFVVRPVVDLVTNDGPPTVFGYSTTSTFGSALSVCLVGLLAFYVGYYSNVGVSLGHSAPLPRCRLTPSVLTVAVILTSVVALAAFALFLATSGGLATLQLLLSGRGTLQRSVLLGSSGYLYSGLLWLTGPLVLLLAATPRWLSTRGITGLALIVVSQGINIAQGTRSWTLVVGCVVGVMWYLRRRKRPSARAVVVLATVAFLLGVVAPGAYRNVQGRSGTVFDAVSAALSNPAGGVSTFFTGPDTQMVDDLAIELQFVPSIIPHRFGSTYLDDLAAAVPRAIWTEKPTDGDDQLMSLIWPVYARAHIGFSFSLFGEPYVNFGLAGVAVLCATLGTVCRALYTWFARDAGNAQVIAVFALSWPFPLVYLVGGVGVDYPRQLVTLVPALVIIAIVEVRGRQAVTDAPRPFAAPMDFPQ